ncbi:pentatricopeptide repeat-containing protein At3g63370, chloroplastic [Gastrolobium bilobum]|uniref:pentatricopeptide repeat-containing protein At3g63370, chloroplastic n=1 Tax=Gastrolobium bilobum TaxID=150636 RepID=UPI002AB18D21|nr:pentatricopeptide repeat-containing protein At3g63370, chloroplastic [Gastrolobium bilobum]
MATSIPHCHLISERLHPSPVAGVPNFSRKPISIKIQRETCKQGTLKDAFQSLTLFFTDPFATHYCLKQAYSLALELCAIDKTLKQGQQLHALLVKTHGLCDSVFLGTKLVHMYGKCGSFLDAKKVFDRMSERTIFTWNAMIGASVSNGKYLQALELYKEMRLLGVPLDACTFPCVLKACGALFESRLGAEIHGVALKCGYGAFVFVCNALITMYAKCGDLDGSRLLFESIVMENEDTVTWNSIISAHVAEGQFLEALSLFRRMQKVGVASNTYTFVAALQACEDPSFIKLGMEIHAVILKSNHFADIYVANALIATYAKWGKMEDVERVFKSMLYKDNISWNTLLSGLVQNDLYSDALNHFRDMQNSGQKPDQVSVLNMISVSGRTGNLLNGMEVHAYVIRNGIDSEMQIGNTLIDMYAKCCYVKYMSHVFECMPEKDLISCTTTIAGYAQNECHLEALNLFRKAQLEGMDVDPMMIGSILLACSALNSKNFIKEIHGYVLKSDLADIILQNAIVNVYGEVGHIDYARRMFESIESKDIVSWTSMITSCVQNGLAIEALELFYSFKENNIQPDTIALVSVLSAAASLSSLKKGKEIHGFLIRNGFSLEGPIASSLVDVYARCATLENSRKIFNSVKQRDLILWTSMINANGMHGFGNEAIDLFKKMTDENVIPDHITFLALLYACSHSGLIVEGKRFFEIMKYEYQLEPWPEHYACLVDLLGRSNSLEEAYHFARNMPFKPSAEVWCALLGACRIHSNKELGELATKKLLQMGTENSGNYVLISNIFAADGKWNDVEEVRLRMKGNGLKKKPGCSWIEVENKIHTFIARDKSHPQSDEIYLKLNQLIKLLEIKGGYKAQTKFVFHNVSEEEKTQMLYGHSERLALGYGLLVTPKGTSIRIAKNLRICDDCHTFFKIASEVSQRALIVRDANRFHHFERGICSCGDFWLLLKGCVRVVLGFEILYCTIGVHKCLTWRVKYVDIGDVHSGNGRNQALVELLMVKWLRWLSIVTAVVAEWRRRSPVPQCERGLAETHILFWCGKSFCGRYREIKNQQQNKIFGCFSSSKPIDKQSLLDYGIFCCLIYVLNALLDPDVTIQRPNTAIDHVEQDKCLICSRDSLAMAGRRRSSNTDGERRTKQRQDQPSSSRPQDAEPEPVDLPFGHLFEDDPSVHVAFLHDHVNRPLCAPKSLDTTFFMTEGFQIVAVFEAAHLRELAEMLYPYSEVMVRAFYHNLSYIQGELRSRVCGVDIVMTALVWLEVLGYDFDAQPTVEYDADNSVSLPGFVRGDSVEEARRPDIRRGRTIHSRAFNHSRVLEHYIPIMWVICHDVQKILVHFGVPMDTEKLKRPTGYTAKFGKCLLEQCKISKNRAGVWQFSGTVEVEVLDVAPNAHMIEPEEEDWEEEKDDEADLQEI